MIDFWTGIKAMLRVTHEPTGESVTVCVGHTDFIRDKRQAAIRLLRARLAAPQGPERLVRTYEADDHGHIIDPLNGGFLIGG